MFKESSPVIAKINLPHDSSKIQLNVECVVHYAPEHSHLQSDLHIVVSQFSLCLTNLLNNGEHIIHPQGKETVSPPLKTENTPTSLVVQINLQSQEKDVLIMPETILM